MNRWRYRLAELQGDAEAASAVQNVQFVQRLRCTSTFEHSEQIEHRAKPTAQRASRTDNQEKHSAIVEFDDAAPQGWADGFARLDPGRPPEGVPAKRWLHFVTDCSVFFDAGWAAKSAALGWGPLDLFGCDRHRPFARIDRQGLLWLLDGRRLVALTATTAHLETSRGGRLTYYRKPNEPGRVLPWSLTDASAARSVSQPIEIGLK
jgi:hypothetical protein